MYAATAGIMFGAMSWGSNAYLTAEDLTGSNADWVVIKVHAPIIIRRISFFVSQLVVADLTSAQVAFYSRPTSGGTGNQVTLGTLIIPDATALGKVVYKDIAPVRILPGYDIGFAQTVAAASSGTANGKGFYGFVAEMDPEYKANLSNMVASA